MLEIDLALANIGLDLIGQATHFLKLAGEMEGKGRDADALAFHRDVLDFRNCLLVEQPNGDFAQTIARQFLFSNWQELLMREVAAGAGRPRSPPSARKAVKEVAYHARYASRMGRAPRRRHRGEPRAHGRRPRLDVALRRRAVRSATDGARVAASPAMGCAHRRSAERSRSWNGPSRAAASKAAAAAIIPSISAIS